MIQNFEDFCRELNSCGFSMGGGNAKGIFALIDYDWMNQDMLDTPVKWHCGDPEVDPWEWRMRVLEERTDIAYSKVFFKTSGFITRDWYPCFYAVLDVLGVGAYDNGKLIGLAGCSADCEMMYQIGVDVLSEYRRGGIASALTSRLALETLALDKVPFYCAAWCNIKSVRNAIRSGFRPAWVAMTAKDISFVDQMNRE